MTAADGVPAARERAVIGLSLSPTWLKGDAWRRRDSGVETMFSLEFPLRAARLAEAAGLDFVFRPDAIVLDPAPMSREPGFASLDPIVVMSALAATTSRIGLVPTLSSTFAQAYSAARQLQSLDRLSEGRTGWNVVTSLADPGRFPDAPPVDDPYHRAEEFVAAVEELRATFPAGALRLDRESGEFADPGAVRTAEPHGPFRATGPLTAPAFEESALPLLHAGGSAASLAFAARRADAIFAMTAEPEDGIRLRRKAARLAAAAGRPSPRILPGLSLWLAETRQEARESAERSGIRAPAHVRHWTVADTPRAAADRILERLDAGAADGVIALPMGSWRSLELFAEEVVPALVAAGRFPAGYGPGTLASRLRADDR